MIPDDHTTIYSVTSYKGDGHLYSLVYMSFYPLAGVAQLVRAPPCHGGGRGFDPRLSRHFFCRANAKISSLNRLYNPLNILVR